MDVNEDMQWNGGEDNNERADDDHQDDKGEEADKEGKEEKEDAAIPNGKKKGGHYSKNPKGSIAAKATLISFYPPIWHKLLDLAKACMWLHVAIENGFPILEVVVKHECQKALIEVVKHYDLNNWEVEQGTYLIYHCKYLADDVRSLSTLQSLHEQAHKHTSWCFHN